MVPKEKGIVAQTVKEVLQSLVDDNLVVCEKIGTSNYFWSFPSAALHARKMKMQTLNCDLERADRTELELQEAIKKAKVGREESSERATALKEYTELSRQVKDLNAQLESYKENDPTLHMARVNENKSKKANVNKWTDNIATVESYCINNFNIPRDQLKEAFNLPSDLDYV